MLTGQLRIHAQLPPINMEPDVWGVLVWTIFKVTPPVRRHIGRRVVQFHVGWVSQLGALLPTFLGEGSPTQIDYAGGEKKTRKKTVGTLILTSQICPPSRSQIIVCQAEAEAAEAEAEASTRPGPSIEHRSDCTWPKDPQRLVDDFVRCSAVVSCHVSHPQVIWIGGFNHKGFLLPS